MIKFFRNIRRSLLNENRMGKYFKYAIGEIILVMIGILLALQINNWNEERKDRIKEQLILKELNKEFKANKEQLNTVLKIHRRSFKSTEYLISQFPIDLDNIDLDSLGYHTFYLGWPWTFNPSKGITNSLTSSASFEIISNDTLRNLLIRWNDIVEDYQEEEYYAKNNYLNHLKPYEKKHFIYTSNYTETYKDPRLDLNFLKTFEFENYVLDRHNDINDIVNSKSGELELVISTIDRIIELSNTSQDD